MIAELTLSTIINEIAITASDTMAAGLPANIPGAKPQHESQNLESVASSYLQRIPSRSRQWEMYLGDLRESKIQRSQRAQGESEDINDFLKRFPIYESPQYKKSIPI